MGTIKDRNGMDIPEAKDIKKRWQEYTELYKKELNEPDNHDAVITHLEPDILECEVKWALGSNELLESFPVLSNALYVYWSINSVLLSNLTESLLSCLRTVVRKLSVLVLLSVW